MGLIASVLFWTLALLFFAAGYAGDRFSKRWIIGASLFFWSVATLGTGLCKSALQLVMLRSFATGVGEAFYAPVGFRPHRRLPSNNACDRDVDSPDGGLHRFLP